MPFFRRAAVMLVALAASRAAAYDAGAVKNGGSIAGVVRYDGPSHAIGKLTVTKDQEVCGKDSTDEQLVLGDGGAVANAVVSLSGISRGKPFSDGPVVLDQKGCRYAPHVLLVPAGAPIKVLNDDGILHNVHTYGRTNPPVNVAQPAFKKEITIQLDEPESVPVKCDTHEWMNGVIVVMDHPYFAKTDEKGAFRLSDVPAGDYTVAVWHEKLAAKSTKVKVDPGKESRADFTLGAKPR
jgi:plastocyanin